MKLTYQAFDLAGKPVNGVTEAAGPDEAVESLRRQGLFVADMKPADAPPRTGRRQAKPGAGGRLKGGARGAGRRMGKGRRLKNLSMFTRQVSVLVSSGTPLVEAIGALERQAKDPVWHDVVCELRARVEEGATLSDAMERRPDMFDAVCRSLIAAGEGAAASTKCSTALRRSPASRCRCGRP